MDFFEHRTIGKSWIVEKGIQKKQVGHILGNLGKYFLWEILNSVYWDILESIYLEILGNFPPEWFDEVRPNLSDR